MKMVIAIDGPAGAGKSTAARALAQHLRIPHFDTGAVYRAVASALLAQGRDPEDPSAARRAAETLRVDLSEAGVLLDGMPPGPELRTREVAIAASKVSVHPEVRSVLVAKQRSALEATGGVAEGRDIGTVVAPDAALKVFLTATPRARASRRAQELPDADIERLTLEIAERDERDANRTVSPLRPASDAIILDTSELDASEVLARLIRLAEEAGISEVNR
ncbi:MAG: (d)CMP kinase [Actinomycetota bacterium]